MHLPWMLKSYAFGVIDRYSLHSLLFSLQKHVTRRAGKIRAGSGGHWQTHMEHLAELRSPRIIEVGAGKSLIQNICLSRHCREQVVVDVMPMLDIELFNAAARHVAGTTDAPGYHPVSTLADIEEAYRIRYLAPFDAREPHFPDDHFDACITTNTLEHIPRSDICRIFAELKRILHRNARLSMIIDYSDHYSHTDRTIGPLNFLQFSDSEFHRWNHSVHHQNRLRHYDYIELFEELGFEIRRAEARGHASLPRRLAPQFRADDPAITATQGVFSLAMPR